MSNNVTATTCFLTVQLDTRFSIEMPIGRLPRAGSQTFVLCLDEDCEGKTKGATETDGGMNADDCVWC